MFINPRTAIDQGWLKVPVQYIDRIETFIQPNAIDFPIDEVREMGAQTAYVTESAKLFPPFTKLEGPEFKMHPQIVYDILSDFYVEIPQGVAAMLIIRSSFSRCGIRLSSGLYDSGYKGNIGCNLINHGQAAFVTERGTRVAQIAFASSDSAKEYAGGWNRAQGQDWRTP